VLFRSAYDVLLRATPNNANHVTVYPVSPGESAAGLPAETPLSSAKATVLRQSPEATGGVWGVSISTPLPDKPQPAPAMDDALALGQEYRLIIPPRQFAEAMISVKFRGKPAQTALQEISEKAGVIILVPTSANGPITLELQQAPVDAILRTVAEQLNLRYEKQGSVQNLY